MCRKVHLFAQSIAQLLYFFYLFFVKLLFLMIIPTIKRHLALLTFVLLISASVEKSKPTLFIIGDSTVKNGSGKGEGSLWGWGDFLYEEFDTTKIHLENKARGGRSSRTFQTEGL